ncbi:uncharacterized protein LOC106664704 isoform X1 [Cimex lectularius]|uniref:Uncharacterized protein n=1 Tax=Cimex lectularius TaxID=79782 RepID=A0A8I6RJA6_CIMLE|nr:uncharacterized protein LOC106664704 isoform X1 [Cimex lectularius]
MFACVHHTDKNNNLRKILPDAKRNQKVVKKCNIQEGVFLKIHFIQKEGWVKSKVKLPMSPIPGFKGVKPKRPREDAEHSEECLGRQKQPRSSTDDCTCCDELNAKRQHLEDGSIPGVNAVR